MREFLAGFLAGAAVMSLWHNYNTYKERKAVESCKQTDACPDSESWNALKSNISDAQYRPARTPSLYMQPGALHFSR